MGGGLGVFLSNVGEGTEKIKQNEKLQDIKEQILSKLNSEVVLSKTELQKISVDWNYKDILRNIEKYEGEIIHLTGFIWKVESDDGDHYVLTVWADDNDDIFFVDYTGSRLLYGDIIDVYATVEQIVEVESELMEGYKTPYPFIKAIQLTCTSC